MDSLANFWQYASGLKKEERRGWVRLGLGRVESVADHSYAVAMLALFEGERRKFDMATILKLALIHDLEEAITGDLTPEDKRVRGPSRVRRERDEAVEQLLKALPRKSRGSYRRLWDDLRRVRTKEARLVHQLDKVEMALQANKYSEKVGRKRVIDFHRSAVSETTDPALRRALRKIVKELD